MSENLQRLRSVLGTADLAWLVTRLRSRLERSGELTGALKVSGIGVSERAAVARLLGRPVRDGRSATVPLDRLDAVLRPVWPTGLESAIVALTGPYRHPEQRRRDDLAWQQARARLADIALARPAAAAWVDTSTRSGALKRNSADAAGALALADRLARLAEALPVEAESLAMLASRLFADAHALDTGTPLGRLAVGVATAIGGLRPVDDTGASLTGARLRRAAWGSVGVVVDELSSAVLAVGLPGGSSSATARALAALAEDGQPALLTYRQLAREDIGTIPDVVHVCENPSVVAAAADSLRAACPPLVCLDGQPGAAAMRLLRTLVAGGATLSYHGDFDGGGMSIARTLAARVPWTPWRFGAADYLEAVASIPGLAPFTSSIGTTDWDPDLAVALGEHRQRVEEESVVPSLLADLAARAKR